MDKSKREPRQSKNGWWRDENPGHQGNKNMSRHNRRQQKQIMREEMRQEIEEEERCFGLEFCQNLYCGRCSCL